MGAHHGVRDKTPSLHEGGIYGGPDWAKLRQQLLDDIVKQFGPLPRSSPELGSVAASTGLMCVADWIGSDETHFPLGQPLPPTELLRE